MTYIRNWMLGLITYSEIKMRLARREEGKMGFFKSKPGCVGISYIISVSYCYNFKKNHSI